MHAGSRFFHITTDLARRDDQARVQDLLFSQSPGASIGVWIPIANPERTARETIALLDATYPQLDAPGLTFITLLNDFAVGEFEKELRQRELLRRRRGRER